MPRGGRLIALLVGNQGQPQMQVRGSLPDGLVVRRDKLEKLPIQPGRLTQLPLGDADLCQVEAAREREGEVASLAGVLDPVGCGPVGLLQFAIGPAGEPHENLGLGAQQRLHSGVAREGKGGMPHRRRDIAPGLGQVGAGNCDPHGQAAELFLGVHDHRLRRASRHDGRVDQRGQRALGGAQPSLAGLNFAGVHQRPGVLGAKHRPGAYDCLGQLLHPAAPGDGLEAAVHMLPRPLGQACDAIVIGSGRSVVQRLKIQTLRLIPGARPPVETGEITPDSVGILREALPQKLAKEMVVTIPVSLTIKWDEKQIGALDGVKGRLPRAGGSAENRIAQRPAETIEDRCVQQELLDGRGLLLEHLFNQIVQHKAMAAGERLDKTCAV